MASKKTLNESNLEALGAKRLAELLIEISAGNGAAKRLLRLELAGTESPGEVAKEIRKRLTTIERSRSFVDWRNRRVLADDLEVQRRAIADRVAKSRISRTPSEARWARSVIAWAARFWPTSPPSLGRTRSLVGIQPAWEWRAERN